MYVATLIVSIIDKIKYLAFGHKYILAYIIATIANLIVTNVISAYWLIK